jgi:hypothetical protein
MILVTGTVGPSSILTSCHTPETYKISRPSIVVNIYLSKEKNHRSEIKVLSKRAYRGDWIPLMLTATLNTN